MKISKTQMVVLGTCALALCACADPNPMVSPIEGIPGFWRGLWHGLTFGFAIWGRLLFDDIGVYAVINKGRIYDFGFALGVGALTGGLRLTFKNKRN